MPMDTLLLQLCKAQLIFFQSSFPTVRLRGGVSSIGGGVENRRVQGFLSPKLYW